MNLLLIAGLLGLALVAILVAVLLGMSEQQAEKARANNATASPESAPATASPAETGKVVTSNTPTSATTQKNALVDTDEQMLPALNGQFREFASELRSLHQQAWELEQHLRGITEMVDRIENTRANHISIEEESRTRSQTDNL
jgi:hypothetical protein